MRVRPFREDDLARLTALTIESRRSCRRWTRTLRGFDYRPQLADLPDAKLWRVRSRACAISTRAATTWPGTCSTAAAANCTAPTTTAWRTSSARSAWS
ncbi:hypothetical protein Aut01nite_75280 [Actinoplanes utahensis]|nr:hypothetical protein Aut01nite_75280 [Actinoplanes utahensis]